MRFSRRTFFMLPGLTLFVLGLAVFLLIAAFLLGQQSSPGTKEGAGSQAKPTPAAGESKCPPSSAQSKNRENPSSSANHPEETDTKSENSHPCRAQNAAEGDNPFPMEQSEAAAKADTQKLENRNKPGTSQGNPFPEAQSKAAAQAATADKAEKEPAPSSAPAGGYSSSNAHLPPPDLGEGKAGRQGKPQKMDSYTRDQTPTGRVADDLEVADFYQKNGNYRGAFLRYQDALRYDPQNDTAQYGLAEALCKENATSDAVEHFQEYVRNHPQGQYIKKAQERIAHPEKCRNNR